jgi:molybdate transport system ATP-binding protein
MSGINARLALARGAFRLDVAFDLPAQGVTALFGPSGAGKTTLLRCLAGLEREAAGRLEVAGEVWQDDTRGIFLPAHRRAVGFVFQQAALFPHLTVAANLEYGLTRTPATERRLAFGEVVAWLGLEHFLERRPESLSGGEAQRVAIARALLRSPRLLLLDEPLAALDAPARQEIFPYLEWLHRQLALPVLYVSHAPAEVHRLADHLLLIERGRLRAAGSLAELATRLDLLPWAGQGEPAAVIEARVVRHDEEFDLSELDFGGGRLLVPRLAAALGERRRVRVLARDVSLSLTPPAASSILNVLPARVVEVGGGPRPLVKLALGETPLLSQVTSKSCALLGIAPGRQLFALVKGVAIVE